MPARTEGHWGAKASLRWERRWSILRFRQITLGPESREEDGLEEVKERAGGQRGAVGVGRGHELGQGREREEEARSSVD